MSRSRLGPTPCGREVRGQLALYHSAEPGQVTQRHTRQMHAHTHTQKHTKTSEGAAGCGSTCTTAGWSHITGAHTHELRCAGAIKQVLQGKRVQQRAHKSGTNTKKREQSRVKIKKKKITDDALRKRLCTQCMTGNGRRTEAMQVAVASTGRCAGPSC